MPNYQLHFNGNKTIKDTDMIFVQHISQTLEAYYEYYDFEAMNIMILPFLLIGVEWYLTVHIHLQIDMYNVHCTCSLYTLPMGKTWFNIFNIYQKLNNVTSIVLKIVHMATWTKYGEDSQSCAVESCCRLVDCPTRWSLWYWYLDFCVDHQFNTQWPRNIAQQCASCRSAHCRICCTSTGKLEVSFCDFK